MVNSNTHCTNDSNSNNNKNNDNMNDESMPSLIPPHIVNSSLNNKEDTSDLLSPWWSEEHPVDKAVVDKDRSDTVESVSGDNPKRDSSTTTRKSDNNSSSLTESVVLALSRSATKGTNEQWKEKCYILATRPKTNDPMKANNTENAGQKDIDELFNESKKCSMICFLKESRRITKERLNMNKDAYVLNPLHGIWITVVKSPMKCKEHLTGGHIFKKNEHDYYNIELGEQLNHSGEFVTRAVSRTFSPLQHLTERYINSWKEGHQQNFFNKFLSSLQRGDAFYLIRDSTKRVVENMIGCNKKPSDKK